MFPVSALCFSRLPVVLRVCAVFVCVLAGMHSLQAAYPPVAGTRVHPASADVQANPAIAYNVNKNGVVVWEEGSNDGPNRIKAQRLDANGVPVGDQIAVDTGGSGLTTNSAVAIGADGKFLVTWIGSDAYGQGWPLQGRFFAADGTPITGEIPIAGSGEAIEHDLVGRPDGTFISVWRGSTGPGPYGVFARVIGSNGVPATPAFLVDDRVIGGQTMPDNIQPTIACAANGSFVISWVWRNPSGNYEALAKRYSPACVAVGGVIQVGFGAQPNGIAQNVAMTPDGAFAVVAVGRMALGSTSDSLLSASFSANGEPLCVVLPLEESGVEWIIPQIAANDGGYIVAYRRGTHLTAKLYKGDYTIPPESTRLTANFEDTFYSHAAAGRLPTGNAFAIGEWGQAWFAWCRPESIGTSTSDVFASPLTMPGWIVNTRAAEILGPRSARFHGVVTPRGEAMQVWFEYETTSSDLQISPVQSIPAGAAPVDVELLVNDLHPHAAKKFRLVGQDSLGRVDGDWRLVTTPNSNPVAANLSYHSLLSFGLSPVDIALAGSDPDGDMLTLTEVRNGQFGTVAIVNGSIMYTPGPGSNGDDTFEYVLSDEFGGTATGTIHRLNHSPVVPDRTIHAKRIGHPHLIFADGRDEDGDNYRVEVVEIPEGHSVGSAASVGGTGAVFTNGGFTGEIKVKVGWDDFCGATGTSVATLTNAAPQAQAAVMEGVSAQTTLDLTSYFSDADLDDVEIVGITQGAFGSVTRDSNSVRYTPGPAYEGRDSFTYTVSDFRGGVATGTVEVRSSELSKAVLAARGKSVSPETNPTSQEVWRSFWTPSMAGLSVGWGAQVRDGGHTYHGVFVQGEDEPKLLVKTGDQVPDDDGNLLANTKFTRLREPVFGGEESFAVIGQIAGDGMQTKDRDGVWAKESGAFRRIAQSGMAAVGCDGAAFGSFLSVAMNADNELFILARLRSEGLAKVTYQNDSGLWHWSAANGIQLLLREGQWLDVAPGDARRVRAFEALSSVTGSLGESRAEECLAMRLQFYDGSEAVGTCGPAGVKLMRILEAEGATRQRRTGIPDLIDSGQAVVAWMLVRGVPEITGERLVPAIVHSGQQAAVALAGLEAPDAGGAVFRDFDAPVAGKFGDTDMVAFVARLNGPTSANAGVWTWKAGVSDDPSLVARKGEEAPGCEGARFRQFHSIAILPDYGVMFVASLSRGSGVNAGNDRGIWAMDSTGELQLIAREGEPIARTNFNKTLRNFDFLGAVSGSPAQRRGYGIDPGRIVYRATFTDGTTAIIRATIP